jgi:hypothetical protein
MDEPTMHPTKTFHCHGGNSEARVSSERHESPEYVATKQSTHQPRDVIFRSRGQAGDIFAKWLRESAEYARFVNPETYVAAGTSEPPAATPAKRRFYEHDDVHRLLWGAALYNNGAIPGKNTRFGEATTAKANHNRSTLPPPTLEESAAKVPELSPLYRWEFLKPGMCGCSERGGEKKPNWAPRTKLPEADDMSDRGWEPSCAPIRYFGLQNTSGIR